LAFTTRALPAAVIYVGYSGFLWMSQPGILTVLMDRVTPAEQAGASALNFFVISLVQAVAVAATGTCFSRFGYPVGLSAMAVLALVAGLSLRALLGGNALVAAKPASARAGA
jgi:hypothetical protein